jgi:PTH1 family peptidyl-tRNA hydrolase
LPRQGGRGNLECFVVIFSQRREKIFNFNIEWTHMILIVGLGNPGSKFKGSRHNLGFAAIDELAKKYGKKFLADKKFDAEVCDLTIGDKKIILAKPQTFMNKSGISVRKIVSYYDISTDCIWVIYDDIDLDIGNVRIRKFGSSGGHKGVQSIIDDIGTEDFVRFRLGIKSEYCDYLSTEEIVLQKFRKEEADIIHEAIDNAVIEIEKAITEGVMHVSV